MPSWRPTLHIRNIVVTAETAPFLEVYTFHIRQQQLHFDVWLPYLLFFNCRIFTLPWLWPGLFIHISFPRLTQSISASILSPKQFLSLNQLSLSIPFLHDHLPTSPMTHSSHFLFSLSPKTHHFSLLLCNNINTVPCLLSSSSFSLSSLSSLLHSLKSLEVILHFSLFLTVIPLLCVW